MSHDEYADIAEFYDLVPLYRSRDDVQFYVDAATSAGGPVLEIGCGTGPANSFLSRGERSLAGEIGFLRLSTIRIALANVQFPTTPQESIILAERAIGQASIERADIICFPECFIPGYRGMGTRVAPPDAAFLERAWSTVAASVFSSQTSTSRKHRVCWPHVTDLWNETSDPRSSLG